VLSEHLIHPLNCGFPIPGSTLDANHECYATKRTFDDNVNFHGPSGTLVRQELRFGHSRPSGQLMLYQKDQSLKGIRASRHDEA